jgi:hypothetical protein
MQIKRFLRYPAMLALMVGLMLAFGHQAAWAQAAFNWSQATASASPDGRCCAGGALAVKPKSGLETRGLLCPP